VPIRPDVKRVAQFRRFWGTLARMRTLIFAEGWTHKRVEFSVERTGLLVHGGWGDVRFVVNCGHESQDLEPLLANRGIQFSAGFVNDDGDRDSNLCGARCAVVEVGQRVSRM
ncbi:MAG: hypothetical protein AB2535_19900, partial [Candidatus Thiodiazotropha endolucinida]